MKEFSVAKQDSHSRLCKVDMAYLPALLNAFSVLVALLACPCTATNKIEDNPVQVAKDRQGDFHRVPKSCSELQSIGQNVNGLYLLKGDSGLKVVFCDFYKTANSEGIYGLNLKI